MEEKLVERFGDADTELVAKLRLPNSSSRISSDLQEARRPPAK
jgi:hypothetical protein